MRAWGHDQTDFQMTPVQGFIDWPLYKSLLHRQNLEQLATTQGAVNDILQIHHLRL